MADKSSGGLFGDEPMAETMERVARDDYYEHRGKVDVGWLTLRIIGCGNDMGIHLSVEEARRFAWIFWGFISDDRIRILNL